jgi:hypothetical protein
MKLNSDARVEQLPFVLSAVVRCRRIDTKSRCSAREMAA